MQGLLRERQAAQQAQARGRIEGLQSQRSELQSQQGQLSARRSELFAQLHIAPEPQKRSLETRLEEIDARSARLDRQIESLNDQISEAMAATTTGGGRGIGVGQGPGARTITIPNIVVPGVDVQRGRFGPTGSNDFQALVIGSLVGEAVLFALIGVVAWRYGMKRMREQFERLFMAQSQQMNQLQQAVDVIGVEVERISEGQRYVAKVLKADAQPIGEERRIG
jgi:cell division protein FtsB